MALPHTFTGSAPWARCIFCGVSRENALTPVCEKAIDPNKVIARADMKEWSRVVNAAMGGLKKPVLVAKTK